MSYARFCRGRRGVIYIRIYWLPVGLTNSSWNFCFEDSLLVTLKTKKRKERGKETRERGTKRSLIHIHVNSRVFLVHRKIQLSNVTLNEAYEDRALTAINDRTHPRFHVCRNDHFFFFFFFFSISSRVSCRVISPFCNAFPSLPRSCYATHNSFFFLSRSRCTRLLHLLSSHVCTSCTHCP